MEPAAGYRRSAGTARAEARRRELLEAVTADLAAHGLVDFSLRRAARAAGTTHKVLLYHFAGADDLLAQAVRRLRERRIEHGLAAALATPGPLSARVRALWPTLVDAESWVLDQAIGLVMYDPARYGELARAATSEYLPPLVALCPAGWPERRKQEVAALVLGALRGFLVDVRVSGGAADVEAGFAALGRALDREEAVDGM